ncbi:hypothetical protein FD755_016513, partial [Muntiacus reevesi]
NGTAYIGLNAALCGPIAASLFRCILHVAQAPVAAASPMAVIPLLMACVSYRVLWGGLVFGGLYPVFLANPVNGGLAARISKPIFRKMLFPIWLQPGFAVYFG